MLSWRTVQIFNPEVARTWRKMYKWLRNKAVSGIMHNTIIQTVHIWKVKPKIKQTYKKAKTTKTSDFIPSVHLIELHILNNELMLAINLLWSKVMDLSDHFMIHLTSLLGSI